MNPEIPDFTGRWITPFGVMHLTQRGNRVTGTYYGGAAAIEGTVDEGRLAFQYREGHVTGEGWFVLQRWGRLSGRWRGDGDTVWQPWQGERGFDGVWHTSYGPMRLFHHADRIHGFYEGTGPASLEGRLEGDRFVFRYQELSAHGEGWFTLDAEGQTFEGQWHSDAGAAGDWRGQRVLPVPGLSWLVVFEAHWQRSLAEEEYSFGEMLQEFFARSSRVRVRHRFFPNEAGLEKWCRELLYLAEPTVLSIATHGTQQGLVAHGQPIAPRVLLDNLVWADHLLLVHFSACLMLLDGPSGDLARALAHLGRFPVSGYTTAVDWAASAILEFTYFELILGRGLDPASAAEHVHQLLTFAGDSGHADIGFPGAGFRFLPAGA
jgi:hypothetical protein